MTPKEKAKELVHKMIIDFMDWTYCIPIDKKGDSTIQSEAKKRALITVDEIISIKLLWCQKDTKELDYWQEVRNEILKL
ncbi:hypothetical protein [Flavobacterium sp.]|uniref:hypothetical protein n=1 Tax=Flavobacterium sp. TaxID=239 RepID=UPI00333FAB2F